MSLREDDRALLQLICEGGQSYEDLTDLLGIPPGEVRARARAALEELGGVDPDAEIGLTDYLLGQADAVGRADTLHRLQGDSATLGLARELTAKLRLIAPSAELPQLPEPNSNRQRASVSADTASVSADTASVSGDGESAAAGEPSPWRLRLAQWAPKQRAGIIGAVVGGGLILALAIALIAGAFSGDDDPATPEAAAEEQAQTISVPLEARGGSDVAGRADLGVTDRRLFVDLDVEGLDPAPDQGDVYVLWMMINKNEGIPVGFPAPQQNGTVSDRIPVNAQLMPLVAAARFVDLSQTPARGLQSEFQNLADDAVGVPHVGQSLARGQIPRTAPAGLGGADDRGGQGQGRQGGDNLEDLPDLGGG